MYRNVTKARLLKICFQLSILVDGHAINDFCPFFVFVRVAVDFIADEEGAARLQNPPNLPEAFCKVRPEIDGFKRCDCIEPIAGKNDALHAALPDDTAIPLNRLCIETAGFFDADSRVIHALYDAARTPFQQPFDIRSAAAAAVQHLCVRRKMQKVKPPQRHGGVGKVHHGDHQPAAEAFGVSCIFKK